MEARADLLPADLPVGAQQLLDRRAGTPEPPRRLRHRLSLCHLDDPKPLDNPRLLSQERHAALSSGDVFPTVHLWSYKTVQS